jgi:hypothetical protein
VKAAIEAFQQGDRTAWSALFEEDADLFDDGSPRSLRNSPATRSATSASPPSTG